jgi:hypothetical protein
VSDSQPARPSVERFTLRARPPLRPLFIAAVTEVVGALLLVLWRAADLPVVVGVLGIVLLVLGAALVVAALVLTARLRSEVLLEADALTVVRGGRRRSLPWAEVREVTLQHPRLSVLGDDEAARLVVVNPRPAGDPHFAAVADAVTRRLDAERGYRELG